MQKRPVLQSLAVALGLILGTNAALAEAPPSPEVPTLQSPLSVIRAGLRSGQNGQPLLRAVASGNRAEVSKRLADGDHVDGVLAGVAGQPGVCAAGIAAATGDIPMLKLLLRAGAAIDGPTGAQSPLAEAALACRLNVATLLIDRGASARVTRGQDKATPLLAACQGACPSIALLLITHGADPHAATSAGVTPLMGLRSEVLAVCYTLTGINTYVKSRPARMSPGLFEAFNSSVISASSMTFSASAI